MMIQFADADVRNPTSVNVFLNEDFGFTYTKCILFFFEADAKIRLTSANYTFMAEHRTLFQSILVKSGL